jgi:hypothetical protein
MDDGAQGLGMLYSDVHSPCCMLGGVHGPTMGTSNSTNISSHWIESRIVLLGSKSILKHTHRGISSLIIRVDAQSYRWSR